MLKKILKSKSGVALENALLFMLVIFSLCALLTSLTLVGFFQTRINQLTLENEVELEEIGEDYLYHVKKGTKNEFTISDEKYAFEIDGDFLVVWLKDNPDNIVLLVEAKLEDGHVLVSQWRYTASRLTN